MTAAHRPVAAVAGLQPRWLWVAVGAILVAGLNFVRQLPEVHSLDAFVFGDPGLSLSNDAMLNEGRAPTRDFAYFYGLLGLTIDRAWYAAFGRTAVADTALLAVCNVLVALGLVRFGRAVDLPPRARWLLLAAVPIAVMPLRYTSPIHAVDAAILVHALSFQARGNLAAALVLAVTGVFVKSALVSVYAAGLVLLILFGPRPTLVGLRQRVRDLVPAAAVGVLIAGLLAVRFGWEPLLRTMFPVAGAKTYEGENFGFFFGIGRRFWLPTPFNPAYYIFGPAGFWLLASIVMLAGVPGLLRDRRDPRAAALLACAGLHVVFIALLFGNEFSWLYYSFLPVLGACGVVGRWSEASGNRQGAGPLMPALLVFALGSWVGFGMHGLALWREHVRTDTTGGLFARPDDAAAWAKVRERAKLERVLVLTPSGAGRVIFPELDSVRSSALLRAVAPPAEVDDLLTRLRTTDVVVLHAVTAGLFESWPPFAEELRAFRPEFEGGSMRVLRRAK